MMDDAMSYAGDVTCQYTWEILGSRDGAALVDVRTTREWETIGRPDLEPVGKQALFVEWQMFPDMRPNPSFAETVDAALKGAGISKEDPVFFLCRSGVRSQGAASAMTALGYTNSYNVIDGFEGSPDAAGQRGKIGGWQFEQLPFKKE